jgi:hypothetical protein
MHFTRKTTRAAETVRARFVPTGLVAAPELSRFAVMRKLIAVAALVPAVSFAEPSADAPVTPAKTYDAAACQARVKTMAQRLDAAFKFADAALGYMRWKQPVFGTPDPGLTAAPITVALGGTKDSMATQWCGAWGLDIGAGEKWAHVEGKQRVAKAVAIAKKRMGKSGRVNVQLMMQPLELHTVAPLFAQLGKLGTLQLVIGVQGAPYVLPTSDAPAWAAERMRAIEKNPSTEKLRIAVNASFDAKCAAMPLAFKKVSEDQYGSKAYVMAEEVPKAAAKCACVGVDVDALELFVGAVIAGGMRSNADGYLELRIDPKSATVVRAATEQELVEKLVAIPRADRVKGVKLELVEAPNAIPPSLRGRCDRAEK